MVVARSILSHPTLSPTRNIDMSDSSITVRCCLLLIVVFLCVSESPADDSLQFSKWSGELNVPDPVAIAFDSEGRAFVTQTQRRKSQDLDIRQHRSWVPQDVGLESVDDKRAFYRSAMAVGNDKENAKHVADVNRDGHHDWRDLAVVSEQIHLLEDTDGDGTADVIQIFAEEFKTEVTGIAAGVLHFEDTVYATVAPDVWRLKDTNGDGKADERSVMATGFGLHIAYAGHDMHGLTVGPDGKIYWSIGDKGISTVSAEGKRFHYPNQGGVMRCNPDGSDFEVFAHGLRNVQELAFDQYGNLFGVDNDADKSGEKERFVYIVKDMDAGWRCNYQYRGNDYDPWMAERLWMPWHEGQPAYIVPPIRNYIDGPAGFAFNPGTALSPQYRDYFFLTGAPNGNQYAFQVKPKGASFEMANEHSIGSGIPLVGINFGPDGGLYGVDWGGGYPLNQKGAVWKIDDPNFKGSSLRTEVRALLEASFLNHDDSDLVKLLGHADQRIRLKAQFELAKRKAVAVFADVLEESSSEMSSEMAKCHSVWGLGQIARSNGEAAKNAQRQLEKLLSSKDRQVLFQALRTIGDLPEFDGRKLVALLKHEDDQVRFMAASAIGSHGSAEAVVELIRFGNSMVAPDTYLRFALVKALASSATSDQLVEFQTTQSELLQLAAVVALRRMKDPGVAVFLAAESELVANEAARAIHDDFSIPDAMEDLAASLGQRPNGSPAFLRRAVNANFRLGSEIAATRLASFSVSKAAQTAWRLEALKCLEEWNNPPVLDRVTGRYREFDASNRDVDTNRVGQLISQLADSGDPKLTAAAMSAATALQIQLPTSALLEIVESDANDSDVRIAALKSLQSQQYPELPGIVQNAFNGPDARVRTQALKMIADFAPNDVAELVRKVLGQSDNNTERQSAVVLLGKNAGEAADGLLLDLVRQMSSGAAQEVWLETIEAATVRIAVNGEIAAALSKFREQKTDQLSDIVREFQECLAGGDASRGSDVFMTHLEAQCIRCHRIGKTGSNVGPNLKEIGSKKQADYLLRSIVAPSADIDRKYRTQVVELTSGKTAQGLLLEQSESTMTLVDSQGKKTVIDKDDIDDVFEQSISIMPEMKKALSRREIRDLVAFLQTLK